MSEETSDAEPSASFDSERVKAIAMERERKRTMPGFGLITRPDPKYMEFPRVPKPNERPEIAAIMIVQGLSDDAALMEWSCRIAQEGRAERFAREQRIADTERQIIMDRERPVTVGADALIAGIIISDSETGPSARIVDWMQSLDMVYQLSPGLMAEYHAGLHHAYAMVHHHMDHAQVDELLESIARGGLWQEPPASVPQEVQAPNGRPGTGEARPSAHSDGVPADARKPWSSEAKAYVARARRLSSRNAATRRIEHPLAVYLASQILERALQEKRTAHDGQQAPSQ